LHSGSRSPSTAEGVRSPTATDVDGTDPGRRQVRRNNGYRGRRRGRRRMVGADGRGQGVTVGSASTGHACQPPDDERRSVALADPRTPSGKPYASSAGDVREVSKPTGATSSRNDRIDHTRPRQILPSRAGPSSVSTAAAVRSTDVLANVGLGPSSMRSLWPSTRRHLSGSAEGLLQRWSQRTYSSGLSQRSPTAPVKSLGVVARPHRGGRARDVSSSYPTPTRRTGQQIHTIKSRTVIN